MNYDKGFGFVGGFVLGGLIGAAVALLLAPSSGEDTRAQIRYEGNELIDRGQQYGEDRVHEAQQMVKQGKKSVSEAQTRFGEAVVEQKDNVKLAMGAGK